MARIVVLGAGRVGRAMAIDLAKDHDVTSADLDAKALDALRDAHGIQTLRLDISDKEQLQRAVDPFDIVVGAVPGFMGFETLKAVIEAGKDVVDISFAPEDMLELDPLARDQGVTALVDIGVAPGMDNILLGYHNESMEVDTFECLVGGLPRHRKWPFEYKAPFSPIDVIEEYTRPARYQENGHLVVKPALSDPELVEFDTVGTLEAFNTDGLRSLLFTMAHIPNMKEKTLRYPGHIQLIQVLKASGFFREENIKVGQAEVSPLDFTAQVLIDEWALEPDEEEITVMRVTVRGTENGVAKEYVYHLHDEYDPATGLSSMARTTGFTCTAAVNVVLEGLFTDKGVFPPELIGKDRVCFEYILDYLAARHIEYRKEERIWEPSAS
ncbi:MAG: saccharopine dehydrogenase family protein [Rhodothermales bacterium]